MIGNDIIDLKIALSRNNSIRERFMEKIFTKSEKLLVKNSIQSEITLWQLWSMKEAAYKAHQRLFNLPRKLNPISFECSLNPDRISGKVKVDHEIYKSSTEITSRYIHSHIKWKQTFQKIYSGNKASVKQFIDDIASEFFLDEEAFSISKDSNGIPSLYLEKRDEKLPISISHHGNFIAFQIPLIKS